ncbi:MAG: hypothetical protein KDB02_13300 [Acidimicrobiales bacterium]|nr:hypothetical protein [Acidimicrobiales bacterium]MCB1246479.1 hypothetical protein [Acidimicrobiia bacterium]
MALPSQDAPSTTRGGLIPAEWSAQAADTVVDTIAKVRDKTTRPAQIAARGLVYGLVVAVLGTAAFVLLMVGITRAWSNWMPGDIWILYLAIAVVFTIAGLFCLGRANKTTPID